MLFGCVSQLGTLPTYHLHDPQIQTKQVFPGILAVIRKSKPSFSRSSPDFLATGLTSRARNLPLSLPETERTRGLRCWRRCSPRKSRRSPAASGPGRPSPEKKTAPRDVGRRRKKNPPADARGETDRPCPVRLFFGLVKVPAEWLVFLLAPHHRQKSEVGRNPSWLPMFARGQTSANQLPQGPL